MRWAALLMTGGCFLAGSLEAQATELRERPLSAKGMDPALRTVVGLLQAGDVRGTPDANRVLIPVLERYEESSPGSCPEGPLRQNQFAVAWMRPPEILRRVHQAEVEYMALAGQVYYDSGAPREYRLTPGFTESSDDRRTEVLVAVVDRGLALFAKQKEADGSGRLRAYWPYAEPLPLGSDALCRGLGADSIRSVHGSIVAEIISRICPNAQYVLAEVGPDMADAIVAIDRIHRLAASLGMRAVINLSLNASLGPHDGTSLLEQILTRYCSQRFVIVGSAGNEAESARHVVVTGDRAQAGTLVIPFQICGRGAESDLEVCLDLWLDRRVACTVSLIKDDQRWLSAAADASQLAYGDGLRLSVCNDLANPMNGSTNIFVLLKADRTRAGDVEGSWHVRLECGTATEFVCHGWMTSTSECAGQFTDYVSPDVTISGPATAHGVVAVGAFSPGSDGGRFFSRGPTRDGRAKPDVFVCSKHATSYTAAMITGLLAKAMHDRTSGETSAGALLKEMARERDSIQLYSEVFHQPVGLPRKEAPVPVREYPAEQAGM